MLLKKVSYVTSAACWKVLQTFRHIQQLWPRWDSPFNTKNIYLLCITYNIHNDVAINVEVIMSMKLINNMAGGQRRMRMVEMSVCERYGSASASAAQVALCTSTVRRNVGKDCTRTQNINDELKLMKILSLIKINQRTVDTWAQNSDIQNGLLLFVSFASVLNHLNGF